MSASKRMKPSTDPAAPPAFMPTHTLTYRAQILHNFGLYDSQELETLDAFLENFVRFGCEPLKDGLTNLFKGMQTAMDVYSQMKTEMHSLHVGVVELKQELTEAKEQHIAAETAAVQSMEVSARHATLVCFTDTYSTTGEMSPGQFKLRSSPARHRTGDGGPG
jgi:hypothetical protein